MSRLMGDNNHSPSLQTLDHYMFRIFSFGRTLGHNTGCSTETSGEWCHPIGTTGSSYSWLLFQDLLSLEEGHG